MSIKNEDIINAIAKMNILDLMDLIKEIEKKFNISVDNINMGLKEKTNADVEDLHEKVEEKTSFTVEMTDFGTSKVNVIKTIRTILDLGLKEAKDFVESLPAIIKKDIPAVEAEKIKVSLEAAGAKIILK
jgi:large subunit ribosomal protein L7/L12